jgi:hypothetical protein
LKTQRKKTATAAPSVQNSCFVAANGYSGFRSRYDAVFASLSYSHVYIICGGPGTGKSHTMKQIADEVKANGGEVQYIYCSSDPDSLDGVILCNKERKIAILDGTAPHTRHADYPGIIDEVINLGEFWNSDCLEKQRDTVVRLCHEKASAYQMAYRYLSLAGAIGKLTDELLAQCIDQEKMEKAAMRFVRSCAPSHTPKETVQYWNACSIKGEVSLSPFSDCAEVFCVYDYLGSGHFYLNALRDTFRKVNKHAYILIPSCYTDDKTEGLYLPDSHSLFTVSEKKTDDKQINMRRFLKQEPLRTLRPRLRWLFAAHRAVTDTAVAYLREAGSYHFALEEIYGAAMNFEEKEEYVKRLSLRIQNQLFSSET